MIRFDGVPVLLIAALLPIGSHNSDGIRVVWQQPSSAQSSKDSTKGKRPLTFSNCLTTTALIRTAAGSKLGLSSICASDGVQLGILYNTFDDAQHATDVFDQEIATAVKILERGKKLDKSGKVVGERAQVLIQFDEPTKTMSAVMWTDGRMFREIYGSSLRDILELEKVYKN
jgi:hypothetical protein